MNIERMKHLRKILVDVRDNRKPLNMTIWGAPQNVIEHRGYEDATWGEPCGTACCAVGYAAFDPKFQAEGLEAGIYRRGKFVKITSLGQMTDEITIRFGQELGVYAAADFFDIPVEDARFMFAPGNYPDPDPDWPLFKVRTAIRENDYIPRRVGPIHPDEVIERIDYLLKLAGAA